MKKRFLPILIGLIIVASGCAKKSELDAANAKLASTQEELTTAKAQLAATTAQVTDLQAKLAAVQSSLVKAREIPVLVGFRRPVLGGPGYVAIFTTTTKREMAASVKVTSRAFGSSETYNIWIPANGRAEIGHGQGSPIEDGDQLTIFSKEYEPRTVTFTANSAMGR